MTTSALEVDVNSNSVKVGSATYSVQALDADQFTVLLTGVPVGRIVYTFGAANGIVEGDISEELLTSIAEAWFAATEG